MNKKSLRRSVSKSNLLSKFASPVHRKYMQYYCQSYTWTNHGRHWKTRVEPFELISVDPTTIKERQTKRDVFHGPYVSEILSGDWDKGTEPLADYDLYQSLRNHFESGVPWKNTEFYERVSANVDDEGWQKWGCNTLEEFESRLDAIDQLYSTIKTEGYRTQRELISEDLDDPIYNGWRSLPPELYEISVVINRSGEAVFFEGRHRLTIAQCLNLDRIPVRVKARHMEWQKYRESRAITQDVDQVLASTNSVDEAEPSHPDL
ncbi:hypothetical protein [Natronorubrum daqingense]|uniref:ParB-like nuclease domain-containing protein n=1 Tax=Natronorubrum daqingense TaxID=588898 RepID=A0A1N7BSM0_9EURY|nr:hypothetical protein [Natronorubrum daqingense]SIR54367.1 hypothetical protein SAMN05421809_1340 [Natronorubrum daqingense]